MPQGKDMRMQHELILSSVGLGGLWPDDFLGSCVASVGHSQQIQCVWVFLVFRGWNLFLNTGLVQQPPLSSPVTMVGQHIDALSHAFAVYEIVICLALLSIATVSFHIP